MFPAPWALAYAVRAGSSFALRLKEAFLPLPRGPALLALDVSCSDLPSRENVLEEVQVAGGSQLQCLQDLPSMHRQASGVPEASDSR